MCSQWKWGYPYHGLIPDSAGFSVVGKHNHDVTSSALTHGPQIDHYCIPTCVFPRGLFMSKDLWSKSEPFNPAEVWAIRAGGLLLLSNPRTVCQLFNPPVAELTSQSNNQLAQSQIQVPWRCTGHWRHTSGDRFMVIGMKVAAENEGPFAWYLYTKSSPPITSNKTCAQLFTMWNNSTQLL